MTAPARLDRAAFDALVQRKVMTLSEVTSSGGSHPGAPAALPARQDAVQEAQLLEAAAREFADAVDRNGKLPYEEAVVITGDSAVVVVDAADYLREPIYWQARAGEVDSLTLGPLLVTALRDT